MKKYLSSLLMTIVGCVIIYTMDSVCSMYILDFNVNDLATLMGIVMVFVGGLLSPILLIFSKEESKK